MTLNFGKALLLLFTVMWVAACQGDAYKLADDPNIPVGSTFWVNPPKVKVPDGASGPLPDKLFDPDIADGTEFTIGNRKYIKIGNGVATPVL